MFVVDTGVLHYAAGAKHPLRSPCRELLQRHREGHLDLTTTVEAVQEFTHAYARRRSRELAARLARSYAAAFDLLPTRPEDLDLGLTIFEAATRLGAFDCLLAAVAINNNAQALISADQAFAEVHGLRWLDPSSASIAKLG